MGDVTLELIHRLANVLLGVSALTVAALIVVEIGRRPTRRREPLVAMRDESPRVLVVEDNRDTSALLRDLLEAEGYQV